MQRLVVPSLRDRLGRSGPRRLLALDGGGLRGLISVEILARIETLLQERLGRDDTFVLAEYFDYIAGTSTGAIIAACLSLGMRISDVRRLYEENSRLIFRWAGLREVARSRFAGSGLTECLQAAFGDIQFGGDEIRTLLLIMLRNASTDSPWPLSNNPRAMFNDPSVPGCNLRLPLWQLVRASAAAPFYFPPEPIELEGVRFVFVDGGVTPFNNPAFQLFTMATAEPYRLCWPTGEHQMLLVSVGTGMQALMAPHVRAPEMNYGWLLQNVPQAFMQAVSVHQDALCRLLGACRFGEVLDAELGDLTADPSGRTPGIPGVPKVFSYIRYSPDLSQPGLDALGVTTIRPEQVTPIDAVQNLPKYQEVGAAYAAQRVDLSHFAGFLEL